MNRAVFLDRDGTINVEKHYLYKPEEFEFIPGAVEAIKQLNSAGYLVIVVTNQSGVGRGYYTEKDVDTLHAHLDQLLAVAGAKVDAYYCCPHHPTAGVGEYLIQCPCRKGEPGMLLQAADEHDIDLAQSWMVGDKPSDIEAGERAGCRSIMVRTGFGAKESQGRDEVPVVGDLAAAVQQILKQ